LDLALHGGAVRRWRFQLLQRSLRDRRDLAQLLVERARLLLLRFAEQLRRRQEAFAHHVAAVAPGLVKLTGLPCRPPLFGESLRHALAVLPADARHRRQVTHGQRRGELAFAHQLLHQLGQNLHQRQTIRHPVPAPVEAARQFLDRATQTALHLLKQPALFQRTVRLAHPQRALQHQRVGFAHLPHDRLDRVAAQLLERADALVPVDDQIAAARFDDDDRRLLPAFSQRSDQPALARRMPYPEVFQAAVQLMKLQLRHRARVSVCAGADPVFSGLGGSVPESLCRSTR
jgi:hypothetical protein